MAPTTRLFLHTEPPTRRLLGACRERRGERWVLASDWLPEEDRARFDACIELPPPQEVGATLARLRRERFDALVVQTEYALLAGSLLAAERGLPAPTPAAAYLCTNKWRSRQALSAAGLPVPRFALARDERGVRAFTTRFPLVLKPIASTLGHLVTRVDSEAELGPALRGILEALPTAPHIRRCVEFARLAGLDPGCDPERDVLVEEHASGPPLETDGLVSRGQVDLFGVTGQVLVPGPQPFIEGYLYPLEHPELAALTEAVVRAVGLDEAGFSIEFRGTTVIEINARLGEDEGFAELFAAGLGQAPILKWIRGERTPSRTSGFHALAYLNCLRDAVVGATQPTQQATLLVQPGTRLHAPPHPDLQPHLAYALRSHPSDVEAAYRAARAACAECARAIRFVGGDAEAPASTRGEAG